MYIYLFIIDLFIYLLVHTHTRRFTHVHTCICMQLIVVVTHTHTEAQTLTTDLECRLVCIDICSMVSIIMYNHRWSPVELKVNCIKLLLQVFLGQIWFVIWNVHQNEGMAPYINLGSKVFYKYRLYSESIQGFRPPSEFCLSFFGSQIFRLWCFP